MSVLSPTKPRLIAGTWRASMVACLAFCWPWVGSAQVHEIVVDDPAFDSIVDGNCTMPEAVSTANGSTTDGCADPPAGSAIRIVFDVDGAIHFDYPLLITTDLEVVGDGVDQTTFECASICLIAIVGYDLDLRELTILGSNGSPPIVLDGYNNVVLERVEMLGGQGLHVGNTSDLEVNESLLRGLRRVGTVRGDDEILGGAVHVEGAATIRDSTLATNRVEDGLMARGPMATPLTAGGALACDGGDLTMVRSTLSGNWAYGEDAWGGAVFLRDCDAILEHVTIVDNEASSREDKRGLEGPGGGIRAEGSTDLELTHSVVGGNLGIVNDNEVMTDLSIESGVNVISAGPSVVRNHQGAETFFPAGTPNGSGDFVGTAAAPLDLWLLPLDDYGGPTPAHLPYVIAGSWVVDRTDCPAQVRDQRGLDNGLGGRALDTAVHGDPLNPCDLGAVEAWLGAEAPLFVDGFESGDTMAWQ